MSNEITFRPVGYVHASASDDEVRESGKEMTSVVEVLPEFSDALKGIDGFTHLLVLFYFHKLRSDQKGVLLVQPKRLLKRGFRPEELPWLGVFSLDSPSRPNPIGVSIVEVVKREGLRLTVRGLDAFDGTPVLDIKPYTPDRSVSAVGVPQWYKELEARAGQGI
jgi:tRNA-Thr(GGU) m(6)t(6)A37 methyltransferase TsaA